MSVLHLLFHLSAAFLCFHINEKPFALVGKTCLKIGLQKDRTIEGQEDKMIGGEKDRTIEGQEDRRREGQDEGVD